MFPILVMKYLLHITQPIYPEKMKLLVRKITFIDLKITIETDRIKP